MTQPKVCPVCKQIAPRGQRHSCPGPREQVMIDVARELAEEARWFDDGGGQDLEHH